MSAKIRTVLYASLLFVAVSALWSAAGWAADPSPPAGSPAGGPPSFISLPHHAGLSQPLVKGWHTFPLKEMPNWHALPIERKPGGGAHGGGGGGIPAPYSLGSTNFSLSQQSAASLPINTSATLAGYDYKGETAITFASATTLHSALLVGGFNQLASIGCGGDLPCAPGATVADISSSGLAPTTWTTSTLPLNVGQATCFFGIFCNILGYDPSLAVSSDQATIYYSYGVCGADLATCSSGSLMIATPGDGKSWTNHEVTSTLNNAFLFFDDKPYMATDQSGINPKRAYVAFDRNATVMDTVTGAVTQTQVVYLWQTNDLGADWSNPPDQYSTLVTPNAVSNPNDPEGRVFFAMPAVSRDGNTVYVVWIDYSQPNARLFLNTCTPSSDPTNPVPACYYKQAHSILSLNAPVQTDIGCNGGRAITQAPSIAVASSGRLYVTFADVPPGESTYSILLMFSDDGGTNWSGPYRLNDDSPRKFHQHYFPALSVVGSTVYVSWLDRRNDPRDCLTQTFSTYSDGILTGNALNVAPNLNVSAGPAGSASSTLNQSNYDGNANGPGDYSGTVGLALGGTNPPLHLQYPLWPQHPNARSAVFDIFTEGATGP